jgi:two-component system CheB/CheR fusion protein
MDELRERRVQEPRIQIYATDLDEDAIIVARSGSYPPNIVQDVTPERLRRFFTKDEAGYRIKKEIREMVVFAVQNVIKDPPFTKLDLLSFRNLMIYLEPELQNRLIPTFHYALKPDGVLFLSSSESINSHPELFLALDRKWKFYHARHATATARLPATGALPRAVEASGKPVEVAFDKPKAANIAELSNRALLQTYAPASVTTDARGNILYVNGDTGRYLRPAPGLLSTNIVDMAREGLQLELRSALLHASAESAPTLNREVAVKTNGGFSQVNISIRRLPSGAGENLLLVSFQDIAAHDTPAGMPTSPPVAANAPPPPPKRLASRNWNATWPMSGKPCRPPSRRRKPRTRSSSPPTRNCNRPTRSCSPPTRNWRHPRKNCNRSMKKCSP